MNGKIRNLDGFTRHHARFKVGPQVQALERAGVWTVYDADERGGSLDEIMSWAGQLRPGHIVVTTRAFLLVPPRKHSRDNPRVWFRDIMHGIEARKASIWELGTDYRTTDLMQRDMLIFDTVERLTYGGRGLSPRRAALNASKKGRPALWWIEDTAIREKLETIYFDVRCLTDADVERKLNAAIKAKHVPSTVTLRQMRGVFKARFEPQSE